MEDIKNLKGYIPLQETAEGAEVESRFLPTVHGKATDFLATMTGKKGVLDTITGKFTLQNNDTRAIIEDFKDFTGTLGVSTHKLLMAAVSHFTNINHTNTKNSKVVEKKIAIPLTYFADLCGYGDIRNARKLIRKDLEILFNIRLSWTEKVFVEDEKGKKKRQEEDFDDVRLIERKAIKSGYINITLTETLANYLVQLQLTQYPLALFCIDNRNSNAYNIGYKMTLQSNMDSNIKKGTAQYLKVKTLLECTSLPTIEEVRSKRKSWQERIKEPFENALDTLYFSGVLATIEEEVIVNDVIEKTEKEITEGWRYCKGKEADHRPLTDEELLGLSYEEWEDTLIYFELNDAPDHTPRLERREEEKKKRQKKTRQNTTKKRG